MDAYCVKCREKREMKDAEEVTMKNGRSAMQGVCTVCGTKLFRMLGNKDKDQAKDGGGDKAAEKPKAKAKAK